MFEYSIETLISKEQISEKIKELATLIKNDLKENENKEIIFVGLLRGSTIFLSDLVRELNIDEAKIDFMVVSSYGNDMNS